MGGSNVDSVIRYLKKDRIQVFLTLILLICVIWLIRPFISLILLTTIFIYIAHVGINRLRSIIKVSQAIGAIIFYLVLLALIVFVVSISASLIYDQLKGIPDMIASTLHQHPMWDKEITNFVEKTIKSAEAVKGGKSIAMSGLSRIGKFGRGVEHILIAFFLSFIFNLTYNHLKEFGHSFLKSRYSKFFRHVYYLAGSFINILGTVVETQLIICSINTVLMTIGLWIIGVPKLLVLAIMVFALGLIPVAGVIISLVPLSIIAFSANGVISVLEVFVLVIIVHLFESYFLHPRLMAGATDLPIFTTFITLIISGELFGAWGLIVGIPIVAFFLKLFDVQMPHHTQRTVRDSVEQEID